MRFIDRRSTKRTVSVRYACIGLMLAMSLAFAMNHIVAQQGYVQVLEKAESEAGLIVDMTTGFVKTYSAYNARYANGALPNPATFRAKALQHLEQKSRDNDIYLTRVVGLPGREIAEVAEDENMRNQMLELQTYPSTRVQSEVIVKDSQKTHRSVWAFIASDQACADCHNHIQNLTGDDRWQLGDLMGAQVVEQIIDQQLAVIDRSAYFQALLLFTAVAAAWICSMYLLNHVRMAKELKTLATTDHMTGCINRREFYERVSHLQGLASGALLMLDLDKFKQINDTYGHDAGDEVIRDFSRCVRNVLRTDDWFSRFGGEEFVVWLQNVKPIHAIQIAERIKRETENSQVITNRSEIRYTVSIGLQMVQNEKPKLIDTWIQSADKLLYRAKSEGRNRIICG